MGKTTASIPTAMVQLPLSDEQRASIHAKLQALPQNVRGDDVARLIEYVEEAVSPVSSTYRMLGLTSGDVEELEQEVGPIQRALLEFAEAARRVSAVTAPAPADPEHANLAIDKPWRRRIDSFSLALGGLVHGRPDGWPIPRISAVRGAIELASRIGPPIRGKRGAHYDAGPGSGLVRAVCLYVWEQPKLTLSYTWREQDKEPSHNGRRGGARERRGDSLPTTNRTVELIVRVAEAFQLPVDKSALRGHLANFRQQLRASGRTAPEAIDLYGHSFDDKEQAVQAIKVRKAS